MTIRRRVFLSLGILVVCVAALIGVAAKHYFELINAQRGSAQGFQVSQRLHDVDTVLSVNRGLFYCIITGNPHFNDTTVAEAVDAGATFDRLYEELFALTADNPEQRANLAALRTDWKILERDSTIPLKRMCATTSPQTKPDLPLLTEIGHTRILLTTAVRRDLKRMTQVEEGLLSERRGNLDRLQTLTGSVLALVATVTLVLVILTGTSLVRAATTQDKLNLEMGVEVDQRRAVEKRLTDSEMRVRAILGNVPDGIITIDSHGLIQSFNPSAEIIFRCAARAVIGLDVAVLMSDSDGHLHGGYMDRYASTGEGTVVGRRRELVGVRADGERFPMDLAVTEIVIDGERLFTGIVRDISEQRRQSEALNRFQAVLDNTLDMIVMFDPVSLLFVYANRGATEALQYSRAEMLDMYAFALTPSRSEHSYRLHIAPLMADSKPWLSYETVQLRRDGSEMPVEIFLQLVRQSPEDPGLFVSIARDLTERRRIDTMKSEFISVVSHELRTPLTSIRGSLGLLVGGAAGGLPERAKRMVQIAHHNSERLVRLINDMLDMEKIESGNMRFEMQPISVALLVGQAMDANRGYALQFQVEFHSAAIDEDLHILGDADRLMQVMANLMSNAAKFSPAGASIAIAVAREDGRVRISVIDRGLGVPEAFRASVFQPFSQADTSDSRQKGGTGLGLSISKAIIERHGGSIGFAPADGGGTEFWFDIPRWQAPAVTQDVEPSRILVCEAKAAVASMVADFLRDAGFEVDTASTTREVRHLLASTRYAVLTLDADSDDQAAIAFVNEFGAAGLDQLPPTVMVSAHAASCADEIAVGHTVLDWLVKPLNQSRLLAAVRRAARGPDGRVHLLHIEDDFDVREIVAALVGDEITVTAASTVAEAAVQLKERVFDLVVLDVSLPDGSGAEVLPYLAGLNAATPVLVFSANDPSPQLRAQVHAALLKSHTSNADLLDTMRRLIS